MANNISAGYGGCGGSAAVSSQLNIVYTIPINLIIPKEASFKTYGIRPIP